MKAEVTTGVTGNGECFYTECIKSGCPLDRAFLVFSAVFFLLLVAFLKEGEEFFSGVS